MSSAAHHIRKVSPVDDSMERTIGQEVVLLALGLGEQTVALGVLLLVLRTHRDAEDALDLEIELDAAADLALRVCRPVRRQRRLVRRRPLAFELA